MMKRWKHKGIQICSFKRGRVVRIQKQAIARCRRDMVVCLPNLVIYQTYSDMNELSAILILKGGNHDYE